jgi:branched-chain amino acid transport system substrate-binding protein
MRAARIVAAIAAVAAASLAIGNAAGSTGSHKAAKKPIVIGFAIGETGFIQPFDVPGYHSWQLVINAQNKKGGLLGRKITTTLADTKSDINQGTIAGQQVLAKGASFMVVTCDYNYGGAAARVANAHKVIVFSICAGDPHFGRQGIGPYAFTDNYATPIEGSAVAEFAYSRGWRHAYQLIDTSVDYDKSLCGYMEQRWKMYGLSLAGKDTFTNSDTSIATQVSRLKATPGVDFVMLCSYPPGGATAVKQLRNSGVKLPIVSGNAFDGTFWLAGIPSLNDFYAPVAASIHLDDPRRAVNNYVKAYKKLTGTTPVNAFAVWAYEGAQVLMYAVKKAKSFNSDKIVKVLETSKNIPTIAGPFTFTHRNHFNTTGTVTFIRYVNGKPHFVKLVKPKRVPPVKY